MHRSHYSRAAAIAALTAGAITSRLAVALGWLLLANSNHALGFAQNAAERATISATCTGTLADGQFTL
jgi:hypothetical protein